MAWGCAGIPGPLEWVECIMIPFQRTFEGGVANPDTKITFCAVGHIHGRIAALPSRFLPLRSNPPPARPDQPCETAIERDTGGYGRRPDRKDRTRRPARHAGAVRTASCQGVSIWA